MLQPRSVEGGEEIYDVLPDVCVGVGYLDSRTAYHASRTALRYLNFDTDLPFVTNRRINDTEGFVGYATVGVFSPLEYKPDNTLLGHDKELARASSFVRAVKALGRVAGLDPAENNYVKIMVVGNGSKIETHADRYDGARTIVQLAGERLVEFQHTGAIVAETSLWLFGGDAYRMQFRDDHRSVRHRIQYYGNPYSVAIYTDAVPE